MTHFDPRPAELAEYPAVVSVPVQWGDQDAFGHVNNAVPLRWFESSRIAYLENSDLGHLMAGEVLLPVVASITCHFRREILYPDTVLAGTRVGTMARSSMTLAHAVFSASQQRLVVDGETVVVFVNANTRRPTRIPDDLRLKLRSLSDSAP